MLCACRTYKLACLIIVSSKYLWLLRCVKLVYAQISVLLCIRSQESQEYNSKNSYKVPSCDFERRANFGRCIYSSSISRWWWCLFGNFEKDFQGLSVISRELYMGETLLEVLPYIESRVWPHASNALQDPPGILSRLNRVHTASSLFVLLCGCCR